MSEAQSTSPELRPPSGSRRPLEVDVDHVGPREVVVIVSGGLDVTTAGRLRAALTAGPVGARLMAAATSA